MVIVIATIQCRPGCREDFLTEFRRIVPIVREEAGCIEYGPTVDMTTEIGNQNTDSDRVTIVEKWDTVEHLQAHLVAPHMMNYRPLVQNLVQSSELRVLQEA